jgi:hypothetical protein
MSDPGSLTFSGAPASYVLRRTVIDLALSKINISAFFNALHPWPRGDGQRLLTPVPISS